jgi:hypothetical protein
MSLDPVLLPVPRQMSLQDGEFKIGKGRLIVLDGGDVRALLFSARCLQERLSLSANVDWDIVAGTAVPQERIGAHLAVVPGGVKHLQGYRLTIASSGLSIVAASAAGIFYGVNSAMQLLDGYGAKLPAMRIDDWPDYAVRGVMLDISRDKVPSMETLMMLVDKLASWKINQLQLYTEHTFAYQNHPTVWAEASPMTGEEIMVLDAYCQERFVELVPNQNSFGHMRRWLKHAQYNHLAECPDGCDTIWGHFDEPFTLYPGDPGSLELVRGLYDELLPHFSSRQFNVGCDETVDLGQGRSAEAVKERGAGQVYFDFLKKVYAEVKARGRTMQFWGDIIVNHPELVAELPRDVVALEWGYEADHPFDERGALYARSGIPFYVCPGTSSWNTLGGRTQNAFGNLLNAAGNGLKHGAAGYLNTDWGDNGHWQMLPVSYLGFAYGAALSWALEANEDIDLEGAASWLVFGDISKQMGSIAYDLGNVYLDAGGQSFNGALFFYLLQISPQELYQVQAQLLSGALIIEGLRRAEKRIDELLEQLSQLEDAVHERIRREFVWTAEMMRHGCRRGIWMLRLEAGQEQDGERTMLGHEAARLIREYGALWQARNRPGGFADSVALMEKMRADYSSESA